MKSLAWTDLDGAKRIARAQDADGEWTLRTDSSSEGLVALRLLTAWPEGESLSTYLEAVRVKDVAQAAALHVHAHGDVDDHAVFASRADAEALVELLRDRDAPTGFDPGAHGFEPIEIGLPDPIVDGGPPLEIYVRKVAGGAFELAVTRSRDHGCERIALTFHPTRATSWRNLLIVTRVSRETGEPVTMAWPERVAERFDDVAGAMAFEMVARYLGEGKNRRSAKSA